MSGGQREVEQPYQMVRLHPCIVEIPIANPGCSMVRPGRCPFLCLRLDPPAGLENHRVAILGSLYPHVLLANIPMSIWVCLKMGYNPSTLSF